MLAIATTWAKPIRRRAGCWLAATDGAGRLAAALLLSVAILYPWISESASLDEREPGATAAQRPQPGQGQERIDREILFAGYVGAPFYYRSDVHLVRPDGTDLTLKKLGWDGDPLYFPIDGGIRSVEWWNNVGFMVDFLHNKAIARLGRGAHGRRLSNPVVETVDASGTIAGQPAPPRILLTDLFDRFEFTHGHNMLFFTPMVRTGSLTPRVRPFFGIGGGFALPHVEVWHNRDPREDRTNEYQFAGPAAHLVAGLELRSGRTSYFVEYKFSWASISAALTGDESWKNFNMPGDLWRQFSRWWRGEEPRLGRFTTRLSAHQINFGAGWWWQRKAAAPTP